MRGRERECMWMDEKRRKGWGNGGRGWRDGRMERKVGWRDNVREIKRSCRTRAGHTMHGRALLREQRSNREQRKWKTGCGVEPTPLRPTNPTHFVTLSTNQPQRTIEQYQGNESSASNCGAWRED